VKDMATNKKSIKSNINNSHRKMICALAIVLLLAAISIISANKVLMQPAKADSQAISPTTIEIPSEPTSQESDDNPQFAVDITYAYVGPRTDHFTCQNPIPNGAKTLNARTLYPAIVFFNFTHLLNKQTSDAKMDVYLIQITTDTGITEKYMYAEATNYDSAFSTPEMLSSHINDFSETRNTDSISGGFVFNWSTSYSHIDGRVGSYSSFTSKPSELGLWKAGEPNAITVSVKRIGTILAENDTVTTAADSNSENIVQISLQKFSNGFIYNTLVPSDKLSQINLYNPPIPEQSK
jgi:hypothetical protein